MSTKKEQALEIFRANSTASRADIIQMFVSQIGMTAAGAATYYAACKHEVLGTQAQPRPEAVRDEDEVFRPTCSVVVINTNDEVAEMQPYADKGSAMAMLHHKRFSDRRSHAVVGCPRIGTPFAEVTELHRSV